MMNDFLELFRLTTILIGKLSYAFSFVVSVYLISESIKGFNK